MSIKEQIKSLQEDANQLEDIIETDNVEDTTVVDSKIDITEDVNALFNGEDGLTEEFRTKATTIFEAAVVNRVAKELERLEEENSVKLEEALAEQVEGLVEKVDGFLNYMVEQWMKDNEVALDNGIRTEITENFIQGLRTLFVESYIEVPEEKLDYVAELEESLEDTNGKLNSLVEANIELKAKIEEGVKLGLIEKVSADLTDVDVEKFKDLVEELSFDDAESFENKLVTIKESYFTKKSESTKSLTESVITDTPVDDLTEEAKPAAKTISPRMAGYLEALNK